MPNTLHQFPVESPYYPYKAGILFTHGKMRLREVKWPAHITQPTDVSSSSPHQDRHPPQHNWIPAQWVCRFISSASTLRNHLFAKQPTLSPCQNPGSLPSPAREPQKCKHLAFLVSGTGLRKRKRWAKRQEFPSLPWLLPHDAETLSWHKVPCHTMAVSHLWLWVVEMSF